MEQTNSSCSALPPEVPLAVNVNITLLSAPHPISASFSDFLFQYIVTPYLVFWIFLPFPIPAIFREVRFCLVL